MPNLEEIYRLVQDLNPPVKRIEVDLGGGIQFLRVEEVVFITTDDKRLRILTASGQDKYNFMSLANMEKLLLNNRNFIRIHRSYIINMDFVDRAEKKGADHVVYFSGLPDISAPVGRGNLALITEYFAPKPE